MIIGKFQLNNLVRTRVRFHFVNLTGRPYDGFSGFEAKNLAESEIILPEPEDHNSTLESILKLGFAKEAPIIIYGIKEQAALALVEEFSRREFLNLFFVTE